MNGYVPRLPDVGYSWASEPPVGIRGSVLTIPPGQVTGWHLNASGGRLFALLLTKGVDGPSLCGRKPTSQ